MIGKFIAATFTKKTYAECWDEVKEAPFTNLAMVAVDIGLCFVPAAPIVRAALAAGSVAMEATTNLAIDYYEELQWLESIRKDNGEKSINLTHNERLWVVALNLFVVICTESIDKYSEAILKELNNGIPKTDLSKLRMLNDLFKTNLETVEEVIDFLNTLI